MGLVFILFVTCAAAHSFNNHYGRNNVRCVGFECDNVEQDDNRHVDCNWNITSAQWERCRIMVPVNYTVTNVNVSCADLTNLSECQVTYELVRVLSSDLAAAVAYKWLMESEYIVDVAYLLKLGGKVAMWSVIVGFISAAVSFVAFATNQVLKLKRA